jgi:hypothetical protein
MPDILLTARPTVRSLRILPLPGANEGRNLAAKPCVRNFGVALEVRRFDGEAPVMPARCEAPARVVDSARASV